MVFVEVATMSKHTIKLSGATVAPTAWRNFFNRELATGPRDHNSDITADYIDQQLRQYRGRYVVDSGWGELQFESEADLNFFLLKFS
jgi:hypothetical protein